MTDALIGQMIGRYKILELIGEGGMATVYRAFDPRLERDVAIKIIRRDAFSEEQMQMVLQRFEREAKSVGKLMHPNIVPVIDYGEFEGAPYLVMVYLPGGTLRKFLGTPIPWRKAIEQLLPIAGALEYVHARNIINRDVKPSNILLTEDRKPLLTDFGLVKLFEEEGADTTSITGTGAGLGTPDYMAPEQWTGESTVRSDLYSLGVVLYEMITGHRPYMADTPGEILMKQANDPLPLPKDFIPDLPGNVEAVLLKVLAKEPQHRYEDMGQFISELEKLLEGKPVEASTVKIEKLREQMGGTTIKKRRDRVPAPETVVSSEPPTATPEPAIPETPRRRNLTLPVLLIVAAGMLGLVIAIAGCYFLYANTDILSSFANPITGPTQVVIVEPNVTSTEDTLLATPVPATNPPTTEPTVAEEIQDDKGVTMRLVPAGEFTLGSDEGVDAISRPAHIVQLDVFYIDQFETTNTLYARCVDDGECRRPHLPGSITRNTYFNNPNFENHPVLYVDWAMAKAFCSWRDARLPTEAEWEKSARGTDGLVYPWETQERSCFYSNLSGCEEDTTPVDTYEQGASPYGIYDLSGNVWEWTSSLIMPYPYDAEDGREDPSAKGKRVARGGAWHSFGLPSGVARSDTRFDLDPSYYGAYVGIRCVKDVVEE